MAYSKSLASRIREVLQRDRHVVEKKMFGGVVFLLNGNMLVGVWETSLIARLGAQRAQAALQEPHVTEFDITGKPMKNWVMIEANGIDEDQQLQKWIDAAYAFVVTLPAK